MKVLISAIVFVLSTMSQAWAGNDSTKQSEGVDKQLAQLERQVEELRNTLDKEQENTSLLKPNVEFFGAARVQYSYEDYNSGNKDRNGDIEFESFRLGVRADIGDVELVAEYRFQQYMHIVRELYAKYHFNENWDGEIGIIQVPFGNLPFNSNSYFFSSGYYVGLEDDHDAGLKLTGNFENHDFHFAFLKNDEHGGLDGYLARTPKSERYSYDVIGTRELDSGEGIWDEPTNEIAESDTFNLRYAYKFDNTEIGVSYQFGDLVNQNGSVGDKTAYAVHLKSNIGKLGILLQYSDYEHDLDDSSEVLAVGAWAFYDSIPAAAKLYNINFAYNQPVSFGPITNITFYNDYNLMTDKSGNLQEDTVMNATGMAISSGGLFTYIEYMSAKNQPFIGGSMAGSETDWNHRLNINIGYYF